MGHAHKEMHKECNHKHLYIIIVTESQAQNVFILRTSVNYLGTIQDTRRSVLYISNIVCI